MDVQKKMRSSAKWTLLTEIISKIVTPLTGMILARLLDPSAFGVLASLLVVTSFAEMFADSGLQKYLVQHNFKGNKDLENGFNVAIYTSVSIAIVIWLIIAAFAEPISKMLSSADLAFPLQVMSVGIILESFNGVQMAIFKRNFRFDMLFRLRMMVIFIPLVVTIPCALLGYGYWSLIFGTLIKQIFTCIFQARYCPCRLQGYYSWKVLRNMLSFSLWSLVESISIWLTSWGGFFVAGLVLESYYLGLFRGGLILSGTIFGLVTAPIIPVFFSALSRLQGDEAEFSNTFFDVQKKVAFVAGSIGIVLLSFSDFIVSIALGEQWKEIEFFIGLLGVTDCISVSVNSLASEALRAKGMPMLSCLSQVMYFPVKLLAIYFLADYGFDAMAIGVCICSVYLDFIKIILLNKYIFLSARKILRNIAIPSLALLMISGCVIAYRKCVWNYTDGYILVIIEMFLALSIYFGLMSNFREYRYIEKRLFQQITYKLKNILMNKH